MSATGCGKLDPASCFTQRCVHSVCGLTLYSCSFHYVVRIFRNVPIKQPLCKNRGTTLLISLSFPCPSLAKGICAHFSFALPSSLLGNYIVYSIGQILVEWQVEVLRGLSSIHQLNPPGKPELRQFQLHSQRCFRGQHLKSKAKVDGLLPRVSASGQQVVAQTKVTQIDRSSKSFAGRGWILGPWRPWRSLSPPFTSHIYNPKNINLEGFWMGSGSLF